MPTTSRYLTSVKNVPAIFQKIRDGSPPDKFNYDHLKAIGFNSSNDRAIMPVLKDLGFLSSDGTPTQRYRDYRDSSRSKAIMAEAIRDTYADVFKINEKISKSHKDQVIGLFKSLQDSSDPVADCQARTFFALLDLADMDAVGSPDAAKQSEDAVKKNAAREEKQEQPGKGGVRLTSMPLTYRFEIQLPSTKDVEVFRAIFRAMREELFDE